MNFTGARGGGGGGFGAAPRGRGGRGGSRGGRGGRSRGRGRGGRGRGRGGGGGGGGLKFADDIAVFDTAVDAHVTPGRVGVQALCASAENGMVFTGGLDGNVQMFSIDGSSTVQPEGKEVSATCIHGPWLFVGFLNEPTPGQNVGFVKSYNFATTPPEMFNFEIDASFPAAHRARVSSICVGGDLVFTGGEDGAVRAWKLDGKSWRLVGSLGGATAHNCEVRKVVVVNNFLYTAAFNGEIKVWNLSGVLQGQFPAHQDMISDACGWSGNGQSVLLTCSTDTKIKVWGIDANSGMVSSQEQLIYEYPPAPGQHDKPFTCMTTHTLQDGRNILICGLVDGSIQILDLPHFTNLGFLRGHQRNSPLTCMAIVPAQQLLFTGAMNGKLNCFKFAS